MSPSKQNFLQLRQRDVADRDVSKSPIVGQIQQAVTGSGTDAFAAIGIRCPPPRPPSLPADSLQGNRNLCSATRKKLDSASDLKEFGSLPLLIRATPWFQPPETWSRESSWPTELWVNTVVLFQTSKFVLICYSNNRRLIYLITHRKMEAAEGVISTFHKQSTSKLCHSRTPLFFFPPCVGLAVLSHASGCPFHLCSGYLLTPPECWLFILPPLYRLFPVSLQWCFPYLRKKL